MRLNKNIFMSDQNNQISQNDLTEYYKTGKCIIQLPGSTSKTGKFNTHRFALIDKK